MDWIAINEKLPKAGRRHTYIITDGKNISVGWLQDHEKDEQYTLYMSARWVDECNILKTDINGFPKVQYWMELPQLPSD